MLEHHRWAVRPDEAGELTAKTVYSTIDAKTMRKNFVEPEFDANYHCDQRASDRAVACALECSLVVSALS